MQIFQTFNFFHTTNSFLMETFLMSINKISPNSIWMKKANLVSVFNSFFIRWNWDINANLKAHQDMEMHRKQNNEHWRIPDWWRDERGKSFDVCHFTGCQFNKTELGTKKEICNKNIHQSNTCMSRSYVINAKKIAHY